jgi:hypothetical protein
VSRLREIFGRQEASKPLDSDGFVIGLFQIVFGLWLLMPSYGFLFIEIAESQPGGVPFLSGTSEYILGVLIIIMGAADMVCIWYKKYTPLKNLDILGAAYWAFVTMSWLMTEPHSTAVPVYGFFMLFSIYEFYIWSVYCRNADLRNKRNVGNI